ncbi:MAG: hypothetical protein ABF598_03595 [Liquorilactobacillus satsumensis]
MLDSCNIMFNVGGKLIVFKKIKEWGNTTVTKKFAVWLYSLGFIIGTFCIYVLIAWSKGDMGSVADWVSAIGSLGAILIVIWQVHQQNIYFQCQRKLDNQPKISIRYRRCFNKNSDSYFVNEDASLRLDECLHGDSDKVDMGDNQGYELLNLGSNTALDLTFIVQYKDDEKNIMKIDSLPRNKGAIFFTSRILNGKKGLFEVDKDVTSIKVYYKSLIDVCYCQVWENKYLKKNKKGEKVKYTDILSSKTYELKKNTYPRSKLATLYMGGSLF